MRRLAAFYLLAVLLLSCSSNSDGDRAQTLEEESGGSKPAGNRAVISQATLESGLLGIADMPTGWTLNEAASDDDDDGTCGLDLSEDVGGLIAEVERNFAKSQFGPFLVEAIAHYSDGDKVWLRAAEVLSTCREHRSRDDAGKITIYKITPLSFPKLGDGTIALRMTGAEATLLGVVGFDIVLVKLDDVIMFVAHGGFGFSGPDTQETEALVRKAHAKLQLALQ